MQTEEILTPTEPSEDVTQEGTEGEKTPKTPKSDGELSPDERIAYEKKISDQARGVQKILDENKDLKAKLAEKAGESLSDEELTRMEPNYEFMSDKERADFKEKIVTKRRLLVLEAKDKWREDFKSLPQNIREAINKKGGEDAFKDFACTPENAGASLETLAKSFVFDEKSLETKTENKPKVPGMETATGGERKSTDVPPGSYTAEEAASLRTRDPKKYSELVAKGRLKIVDKK